MYRAESNLRSGENPEFNVGDFFGIYPQFGNMQTELVEMYLDMAKNSILKSRWHSKWRVAVSLYVAHYLTLWLMTSSNKPLDPNKIIGKAESKGAVMSKSVDGVSISYGASGAESDLAGAGSFKSTIYGQQLMTMAKLVGMGGMYVR